ncbi:MAG: 3-oxoacyl-ACP reductase [Burkholderiales bacterium PBB5]|nr:MAG: 3-oxoacyl-ACP reductase [Burkholderiales bacterium PBB5]
MHVLLVARGAPALQQAVQRLQSDAAVPAGTQVLQLAADITTAEGRAAVFALRPDFDIVVTNAGGPPPGDFRQWDRDAWIGALDANMLTPIELIKATVDKMAERGFGRVVNITSGAVKAPIDFLGLSNGARSGLTGFVAGLSRQPQLAGRNVTINSLLPGSFDTDRLKQGFRANAAKVGVTPEELADRRRVLVPAQRFGNAAEFGEVCAFMCSAQAGYLTGQNILLDGGAYPGTY